MAHVLGTVGILFAFGAGAAADHPYAAESLSKGKTETVYKIKGSPMGEIVLDVGIDTLLENEDDYYMVVNFWSAQLTDELALSFTVDTHADNQDVAGVQGNPDSVPPVATTQPMVGNGAGFRFYTVTESVRPSVTGVTPEVTGVDGAIVGVTTVTLERAFRGDATDNSGVYKMELAEDLVIDTRVRLDLSNNLAIPSASPAKYRGDLYIYDNLGDARAAARATHPDDVPNNHLVAAYNPLFEVASKMAAPDITAHLATADVGYERTPTLDHNDEEVISSGGPFRGFATKGLSTPGVGVLASITLNEKADNPATRMVDESEFLDASTGLDFEGTVNTGVSVVVTADAGAFGFGNGAGDGPRGESEVLGDNPATMAVVETDHVVHRGGAPKAFRIGATTDCTGGASLTLQAANADGKNVAINPLSEDNATFASQATRAVGTAEGGGPFYFCVLVGSNEVAIPAIGDDRDLDGYSITATPMNGKTPGPAKTGNAGAIDRNGTTLNITYLSVHPAYSQRLVVVNRGTREAEFWMDEFQTEAGTMVMNEIRGTVAPKSRMVIRVQDALEVNEGGMTRASGTLNLTAPNRNIDVMTLQVHPGTGQIDTTVYQHEAE